jgi:DMSO/TMAO reductase YedYZ molybdopterin-dependent catalytic subunit
VTDASKDAVAKVGAAAKDTTAADAVTEKVAAPPRSMDEIESDLAETRARLATRIDDLQDYVSPKNVLQRQVDKAKHMFVDEYGGVRPDRVAIAAGVAAAFVGIVVLRRRRRRS